MNSLRIAILSPFQLRLRRGIEASVESLALEFARSGHMVAILCWSGALPANTHLRAAGVTYAALPKARYFEALWATLFYAIHLLRIRPQVALIFFADYGEAGALALARLFHPLKTVFVAEYPVALVRHRFEAFRAWGLRESLAAIVAVDKYLIPDMRGLFPLEPRAIPNGVDTELFKPTRMPEAPSQRASPYRLVTVAALERRKGYGEVLAALPEAIQRLGPVDYIIVGEGSDRGWLEAEIQATGLSESVTLTGSIDNIPAILDRADLFLLPSYGEGLPIAFLEALAMGLPTIVSTDPPYDEMARPAFSVKVARGDKQGMADAIVALLSDPERRRSMAIEARKEAEQLYAWPVVSRQYEALIEELLRAR